MMLLLLSTILEMAVASMSFMRLFPSVRLAGTEAENCEVGAFGQSFENQHRARILQVIAS